MSVEWRQPKTNWVATDFVNADDHNRIVDNITVIKSLLHDMFPDFGFGSMIHKDYTAWPYASEMNTIENNISALNSHSYELDIGKKKSYRVNSNLPDFEDLNRIESALWTLHEKIIAQQENDTSPTIEITSNTSDWTSNSSYTITGKLTANGNGIGGAKLMEKNRSLVIGQDGTFSTTVTLSSGANTFTIKAWDVDNNPRFASLTKRYDGTLPTITITSSLNSWNTSSTYTVTGYAVDNESGIKKVTVDGSTVTLGSGGSFSKTITLSSSNNMFVVSAENNAGEVAVNTYHVYRDTTPPTITFTSSNANTVVRSYPLSGRVVDSQSGVASVNVNGVSLSIDANGYFSRNCLLSEGYNTFTVTATDNSGNSRSSSLTVYLLNQINNADYNWTQATNKGDTGYDNNISVVIAGVSKNVKIRAKGESHDSYTDPSVGIDEFFRLPKGVSYVSVTAGGNGWGQSGANTALSLYDAHAGAYITSTSVSGAGRSCTLAANITQEQAKHDLYIKLTSSAHGYAYAVSYAWTGIYDWSFSYY